MGSDESYVLEAIQAGYSVMGFSDHSPWPYQDGFSSHIRMDLSLFPDYLSSIRALKEKYKGQIEIYIGLEAEYYPEHHSWLLEQKEKQGLDFLILGSHFDRPDEELYFGGIRTAQEYYRYAKHTIKGMESGAFQVLAHPELFMLHTETFDKDCEAVSRDLIQAAKALNMPLEYNLSGFYPISWRSGLGYPNPDFWKIAAQEGVTAIIGLDAHDPKRFQDTDKYDTAVRFLNSLGVKRIETLKTKASTR